MGTKGGRPQRRDSEDSEMEDATNKHVDADDEEGSDGGSGAEEYEIEAILDAKVGMFETGRLAFLVKWKGYEAIHNSWVREEDAGNAQELIDAYWRKHGGKEALLKKGAPRKSDSKPRASAVSKRRSPESDEDPAPPKKRGKQAKASVSEDEEPSVSKAPKRGRKSAGASSSASAKKAAIMVEDDDDEEESYMDLKAYKNSPSWAHLVDHIETVERTPEGNLQVYFVLKGQDGKEGKLCREDSSVCKEKMPQLLLEFYETNLRWKKA